MHDVSDMTTRIRNALQKNHSEVIINNTKLVENIAGILKSEGFIENFTACPVEVGVQNSSPRIALAHNDHTSKIRTNLHIQLKYVGKKNKPSITYIQSISKPGLRVYVNKKTLPKVLGGLGVAIVSTSEGVFTQDEAKRRGVGGEVLCYVW